MHIFFDFLVAADPEQRKKAEEFIKNVDPRIVCTQYNKNSPRGFDVALVVDLLVGAREDAYDHAIIVSADAGLAPAIQFIRNRLRKQVSVVARLEELGLLSV